MQQTDRALQLPFVCVGLGRTNNYLEDFTVVYMGDGNNQSWTPVIPNSQLLVIPSGTDQEWNLGIYISSIDKIKQVVVITAIILILIGVLIMWLIRKENEEDRRNQFMFFQLIR
jgi:integrin alpha FG-GAP repeat containing protein 1